MRGRLVVNVSFRQLSGGNGGRGEGREERGGGDGGNEKSYSTRGDKRRG